MMGSDARDMMGLPSAGTPKPPPAKAPKAKVKGLTGMSREVFDLNFEGAPPISIVAPKFKEKPKLPFKPRPWEETPFCNSARRDGLVLRHWRRKGDIPNVAGLPATPADSNAASELDQEDKAANTMTDSHFAKYNVKVERPQYTDVQYDTHLSSDDWSREETDYLVEIATEFDLRWIIIGDRYDYQPRQQTQESADSMAITSETKSRTTEDLKARYYSVAANAMVLHNPLSAMSSSEFDTHEKMTKYDPVREKQRKQYAEQLMQRTDEEKYEEEMLLKELSRIVLDQEKLYQERKALYERLEAPPTTSRDAYSTTMYQSSQGLTQLMQNLLAQNKNKELEKKEKRRSTVGPGDVAEAQSIERGQRHSVGNGSQDKRNAPQTGPNHRQLSRADREKYGVSYPQERLTGGVIFRHERVTRAGQAKSQVQSTKISQALAELNIPPRLLMPTSKVVSEYERLIEGIKTLLEVRKVSEKVEGEIRVWEAQKEQREKRERGEDIGEEAKAAESMPEMADAEVEDEGERLESAELLEKPEAKDSDDEGEDGQEVSNDEDEEEEDTENREVQSEEDGDQEMEDEDASQEASEDASPEMGVDTNDNVDADDQGDEAESGNENGTSTRASAAPASSARSMRKRSASVLSAVSNKSSKRQKN